MEEMAPECNDILGLIGQVTCELRAKVHSAFSEAFLASVSDAVKKVTFPFFSLSCTRYA